MPHVCPDRKTLEQLLLDQLGEPQARELEEHLLGCEDCLRAAETLSESDGFTAEVRAARPASPAEESDPALAAAIRRAYAIRPGAETVQSHETLSVDPARPEPTGSDVDEDFEDEPIDFLHPPQEPDELGRLGGYRILEVMGVGGMGSSSAPKIPAWSGSSLSR